MLRRLEFNNRFVACLFLVSFTAVVGCNRAPDPWKGAAAGQKRVLTSFTPLYCFAANVAADHAKILNLLTVSGPHDYEGTYADTLKVVGADLFLAHGLELDGFVRKLANTPGRRKKGDEFVFKVGEALDPKKLLATEEDGHDHQHDPKEKGGHHHHHHGEFDPHVWLSPEHAILMVDHIAGKLGEIDPDHKKDYLANAAAYAKKIQAVWDDGKKLLDGKKNRKVLTTHDSLRYFGQAFDIKIVGSIQIRPGVEADAGQLAKLSKLCKDLDVRVILHEPQYSRGSADTLKQQLVAQKVPVNLVEFDTLETASIVGGESNPNPDVYLTQMRANLERLAKALP